MATNSEPRVQWTRAEDYYIIENWDTGVDKLSAHLQRTEAAILTRHRRLRKDLELPIAVRRKAQMQVS